MTLWAYQHVVMYGVVVDARTAGLTEPQWDALTIHCDIAWYTNATLTCLAPGMVFLEVCRETKSVVHGSTRMGMPNSHFPLFSRVSQWTPPADVRDKLVLIARSVRGVLNECSIEATMLHV